MPTGGLVQSWFIGCGSVLSRTFRMSTSCQHAHVLRSHYRRRNTALFTLSATAIRVMTQAAKGKNVDNLAGKISTFAFTVLAAASLWSMQPIIAFASGELSPAVRERTTVWCVPDQRSGRDYSVSISLPASYDSEPERHYPVLYVTDADYGFSAIDASMRRLDPDAPATREFIIVGLSYAKDEDPADSRLRDYTPVPRKDQRGGGGPAYQAYLHDTVLPFVERKFRTDPDQRIYVGHSYGALLGVQMLLSQPEMFHGYILGSPSLWYANHAAYELETAFANHGNDLPAKVFLYVGEFEAANPQDDRYNKKLDMVRDNAEFTERLKSRGYKSLNIHSEVIPAESHLTVFPAGFAKGIVEILPLAKISNALDMDIATQ